jgi:hypothetical protein
MRAVLLAAMVFALGCGKPVESVDEPPPPPKEKEQPKEKEKEKPKDPIKKKVEPKKDVLKLDVLGYPNRVDAMKERLARDGVVIEITGTRRVGPELLAVMTKVSVTKPERKITYSTWAHARGIHVQDDKGTVYQYREMPLDDKRKVPDYIKSLGKTTGWGSGPVYTDLPRIDVIFCERPTETAEYLDVNLGSYSLTEKGKFLDNKGYLFRIPREMWAR